ncbi:S-adenosyl-L-methionine-dependent methyltransferase [Eremomyces bilateralis CBS 781.70]|uniref:S-adenosyl-L-methionine-dependent methyltransferase n=1 Tax=Eremomyces bilateralis CBS 781.70 TaxID=1392243 RepID=A0A6G1G004_9PEZI|nr:S-adenosyl-L-methionine-dependent methyltransferase [Eremomyces bilateralis CBS 781.70]KAF1811384.1 S-adenosyl-L-methionine-dependent methyltransferase [Eremomyces bilateralis CBS 781.70]
MITASAAGEAPFHTDVSYSESIHCQESDRLPRDVMQIQQEDSSIPPSPYEAHPHLPIPPFQLQLDTPHDNGNGTTEVQQSQAHALFAQLAHQTLGSAETGTSSFPAPFDIVTPRSLERRYADSAYDSESLIGEDARTLASYITNYQYENGRRYHAYKDGAYWGPNDEQANEMQDQSHHMYLLTLDGKLHLSPIDPTPQQILDVGTGTGIWAIDIADAYPSASVIGTDLSPIQPEFIPPNCTFEIDDATVEWTYPEDHFDFIHIREMFGSIPDWDFFLAQAHKATRPGGWVEVLEHSVRPISDDGGVGPEHFYTTWGNTVVRMGEVFGKSFAIWDEVKGRMERAGFVDVHEVPFVWPMNGWSKDPKLKELGKWNQLRMHDGVEGFMLRLLTTVGGWSYDGAQKFLEDMKKQLKDTSVQAFLPGSVVYGRKPLLD